MAKRDPKKHKRKVSRKQALKVYNAVTGRAYQRSDISVLTPQVVQSIADGFALGASIAMIAASLEIRPESFRRWLRLGRDVNGWAAGMGKSPEEAFKDSEPTYPILAELWTKVEQARAKLLLARVASVATATNRFGERDWKADVWMLERLGGPTYHVRSAEEQDDAMDAPIIFALPDNGRGPDIKAAQDSGEVSDHDLLK